MKILIYGNPIDGFHFVGTFPGYMDATEFAEKYLNGFLWWVVELEDKDKVLPG